jgi:MoxR-like ATPase
MLEAMQERQVTIGGKTYRMPQDIFIVIATQNPIEQEGTYPLSEAQTDRFMIKEKITFPSVKEEIAIMNGIESGRIGTKREAVLSIQDLDRVQDIAEKIYIDAAIKEYIANIVNMTRHPELISNGRLANYIRTGASPRASINFLRIAKAEALISGRTYVVPDDVKNMRHQVLRHRIGLNYAAVVDNISVEEIIDMLVNAVPTP